MNKSAVLAAFVIYSIVIVQGNGNVLKNILSEKVYGYLKHQYKDNPVKLECMIDDFQSKQIFDNFYPEDVILNPQKLKRELQPFFEEADFKCAMVSFYESSLGLTITVLTVAASAFVAFCILNPAQRIIQNTYLNQNQGTRDRKAKRMFVKSTT